MFLPATSVTWCDLIILHPYNCLITAPSILFRMHCHLRFHRIQMDISTSVSCVITTKYDLQWLRAGRIAALPTKCRCNNLQKVFAILCKKGLQKTFNILLFFWNYLSEYAIKTYLYIYNYTIKCYNKNRFGNQCYILFI